MPTTTTAIVIPEPGRVELREVALSTPGPDDLTIQTAYTSISAGTERMLLAGRMPHPMLSLPVIPGYETVGRVVALGANVPPEWQGRWVYLGGARCFEGINPAWGGQAATLSADYRRVVALDGVAPQQGVLLALAATALHGVDLLANGRPTTDDRRPTTDDGATQTLVTGHSSVVTNHSSVVVHQDLAGRRVLVLGQGPVGQLAARLARARGAWVAVADQVATRLAHSQADLVANTAEVPLSDQVGQPVDTLIEATGSMTALAQALPLLANDGTILLLGYYDELKLPYMPLFLKQARLLTAREWGAGDLAYCRDLIASGVLAVGSLLTHQLPLDAVAEAYQLALNEPACLKLVLTWNS